MKRKNKLMYLVVMLVMILSLAACSSDEDKPAEPDIRNQSDNNASDTDKKEETGNNGTSDNAGHSANNSADNGNQEQNTDTAQTGENSGELSDLGRSISISANNKTGEYTVSRMAVTRSAKSGVADGWTIFVYLCATDLESKYSAATGDLWEMISASESKDVRYVVQTGGTSKWNNEAVDADHIQRYLIQKGDITLIEEHSLDNMGDEDTLKDFLQWGLDKYASKHIGLIFWNHGGGSITGVCFDEVYDFDSIDLYELDSTLRTVLGGSGMRFDFIGFDACLMGTIESANILATYADYMYGSEEVEPGSGWDYKAIGDYLASNPDADGAALGKVVADSFLDACIAEDDYEQTTLSVIDLSKIDALNTAFNSFAKDIFEAGEDTSARADLVRTIGNVKDFGGNNKTEGYTNMVDLGGLISACSSYSQNAKAALNALSDAVIYKVSGPRHKEASGLSTYYPLCVQGSEELAFFGKICVSPYYISFVDRQSSIGAADDLDMYYDDDQWFDDDGDWYWGDENDYDEDYWDYYDDYEPTGESPYITFEEEPGLADDGTFYFMLDEWGLYNTWDVYGMVYILTDDEKELIEYGETYDINEDWDYGLFYDNFDGYWISLPDGQNLATYIVGYYDDCIIYTSPVLLNGEVTNLRLKLTDDNMFIEGAWDGIDEYGAASREVVKLKAGDSIVPLYHAYSIDTDEESDYYGDEYIFEGEPEIYYDMMYSGDYLYSFCIEDIYGDYYLTDYQEFYIDENGDISYY